MKKHFFYILYVVLSFSLFSNESVNIKILINSPSLVYNNHVGNDWGFGAEINGKSIKLSRVNVFEVSSPIIELSVFVQEDDKYPDYGSTELQIDVKQLTKKYSVYKCRVKVIENRGRYSGNAVLWEFTIQICLL